MLRLFNTLSNAKRQQDVSIAGKKFTRFEPNHVREVAESQSIRPKQAEHRMPPPAAYRPASRAPKTIESVFDDAAHLHSEKRVSNAVLRRALPMRFAETT